MDKITSLVESREAFSTQEQCERHLRDARWPDGVTCPRCGSKRVTYMDSRRKWQCECRYRFSVTAGTIFHKTYVDLPRWLMAIWLVCHSPKGISSAQLRRELGVTYKTAWYMTTRIRRTLRNSTLGVKLEGIVEADIGVIKTDGGQVTRAGRIAPSTNVPGMVSRYSGALQMQILQTLDTMEIVRVCQKNFGTVRRIYTDAARSFNRMWMLGSSMPITHARQWANGEAHTNYVENAWSLLKRGLVGQFHHVSAKLLQTYLDEFAFRYSHRREKGRMMDLVLASS